MQLYSLLHLLLAKYFSGDQMKKNEMGGAFSTYGGGEKRCIQGFGWGNLRGTDHLEDPGLDGRIILKWISNKLDRGWEHGLDLSASG